MTGTGPFPIGESKFADFSSFQIFAALVVILQWAQCIIIVFQPFMFYSDLSDSEFGGVARTFMNIFTYASPISFFVVSSPVMMWSLMYPEPEVDSQQRCNIGMIIHLLLCDLPWFIFHIRIIWSRDWKYVNGVFHIVAMVVVFVCCAIHLVKSWFALMTKLMELQKGECGSFFGNGQSNPADFTPGVAHSIPSANGRFLGASGGFGGSGNGWAGSMGGRSAHGSHLGSDHNGAVPPPWDGSHWGRGGAGSPAPTGRQRGSYGD